MSEIKIIVKYENQEINFTLIDDFEHFLEKCYKEFQMNEEEKKNLKIFKIDEEDLLDIENDNDYRDNLDPNDNNEIIFLLRSKGRLSIKHQLENIIEETSSEKVNSMTKSDNNINRNNKVNDSNNEIKHNKSNLEIKKFDNENSNKKEKNDNINLGNLKEEMIMEFKKINNEMEKNFQKILKRNISDIKAFLLGLGEQMDNIKNDFGNFKKNVLETLSNNNNLNLFQNNSSIENQFEKLNQKLENISNQLKKQGIKNNNDEDLLSKEFEDNNEKFYGCKFKIETITLKYNYEKLMKNKKITFGLTLVNNGNLSWPKNSMLYGKSKDDEFEIKSIINNQNEILPNQEINPIISLTYNNIKNENKEYILPLKLVFKNESLNINQNGFILKLIIEKSKQDKNSFLNQKFNQNDSESSSSSDND